MGNQVHYKNIFVLDCEKIESVVEDLQQSLFPYRDVRELLCKILNNEKDAIEQLKRLIAEAPMRQRRLLSSSSSYGIVYEKDDHTVIKQTQDSHEDTDEDEIKNGFILEMILTRLLFFYHRKMSGYIDEPFPLAFAEVKNMHSYENELWCEMTKFDETAHYYLRHALPSEQIDFMIQLCFILLCLQKSCGFTHGDMHLGNIMIKTKDTLIRHNEIVLRSRYQIFLIDLGMSCADFSSCCSLNPIYIKNQGYKTNKYCANQSLDLRFFFKNCIRNYHDINLCDPLYNYFGMLFKGVSFCCVTPKYKKKYGKFGQNEYRDPSSELDDSDFYPEKVLNDLWAIKNNKFEFY